MFFAGQLPGLTAAGKVWSTYLKGRNKLSFLRVAGFLCFNLKGQLKDWTGNVGERELMTCKGPQSGIRPEVAAARMQPLYIGHPLYHLSHQGTRQI